MMQALVITRLTFLESMRRRIAVAAFVLGVLFLILYGVGFHFIHKEIVSESGRPNATLIRNQMFNFLTTAGLYAVNFLTIAMGVLISADTLAGEISSGTIQTIASKPLRRPDIVLGKWLGFAALLAIYLLLMAGGVLAIVYFVSGYHVRHVAAGLSLIYLASLLIMSVSLACSSMFSTLATGGIVFGLYGIGFIGGWVEQIGSALKNQTAVNVGILSSLIIPSEAIWKRAAYEVTSTVIRSLGIAAGPFAAVSVPNPAMVIYAVFYVAVMLVIAIRQFSKRDL
ncbi:ABC transporter permease [bacterium]|nr:ABC transporter permease [bacterium]MCI0604493.1 ABC transporter permease [bacterium]